MNDPPETGEKFSAALTYAEAHGRAASLLAEVGIETPKRDARVLLCEAAHIDHAALLRDPDAHLSYRAAARLQAFVERRLAREPVSRILGRREFWGLTLRVTPDVLDPRADTETVVATAVETLQERRDEPLRILDLGTGSGALLCALLSEFSRAFGVGVERDGPACRIARENLAACDFAARSALLRGEWGEALAGGFELVVSNPPYIRFADVETLAPEVRDYDPRAALDGGPDGLSAYRAIAADLGRLCAPAGVGIVEIGFDQAESVAACFRQAGWTSISLRHDLENQPRALLLRR
jgi:release factor glutamine methyltransferase